MVEYLGQDGSGSAEIFTTDSLNDNEQNVLIEFSLGALSFFFVNCTKKLRFTHIYITVYFRIDIKQSSIHLCPPPLEKTQFCQKNRNGDICMGR
jgi:hypothetical protein